MSVHKILLRTRVFGNLSQNFLNKKSFINFNNEYCLNLKKLSIKINDVNIYEDKFKSTLYSEINIHDSDLLELRKEDLFYLLKYKYHKESLELKVNYLQKDLCNISPDFDVNQDIFLL
jgi:hypothetical protein